MAQIANFSGSKFDREPAYNCIYISYTPLIMSTLARAGLKETICNSMTLCCYPVNPSVDGKYLMHGIGMSISTEMLMHSLVHANFTFIRIVAFGLKQKIVLFPHIDPGILET